MGQGSRPCADPRYAIRSAASIARLTESRSQPAQHLTETTSEPSCPWLSRTPRWGRSLRSWQMPGRGHQPEEERRADGLIRPAIASASMRYGRFMALVCAGRCAWTGEWDRLVSW